LSHIAGGAEREGKHTGQTAVGGRQIVAQIAGKAQRSVIAGQAIIGTGRAGPCRQVVVLFAGEAIRSSIASETSGWTGSADSSIVVASIHAVQARTIAVAVHAVRRAHITGIAES
jgi:hypothetical protein